VFDAFCLLRGVVLLKRDAGIPIHERPVGVEPPRPNVQFVEGRKPVTIRTADRWAEADDLVTRASQVSADCSDNHLKEACAQLSRHVVC
jgi:hypothetical protein